MLETLRSYWSIISTIITVAFGTFIPTSITVVDTST